MPEITFNQSIKDLDDNISFTIKPQNYSKVEFINILFDIGYEDAQNIALVLNDGNPINLGMFISPNHNPAIKIIPINRLFVFNNSSIVLKIISSKPFKFNLNYNFTN